MGIELFNEIYGCYYTTVRHILKEASGKKLNDKEFRELVCKNAERYGFPETTRLVTESCLREGEIPDSPNNDQAWPLFDAVTIYDQNKREYIGHTSIFSNMADIPLSTLEKRWLKSIYSDPRIQLFCDSVAVLDDVEPIFNLDDFVLFDQYSDGDPYTDEHYKNIFRMLLKGVQDQVPLKIEHVSTNTGETITQIMDPDYIEYSERDDKFRVIGTNPKTGRIAIRVSTIKNCKEVKRDIELYDLNESKYYASDSIEKYIIVELVDDNNTLERFLLHFSHYNKEANYAEENKKYRITVFYDEGDETDVVIRILSFGPHVKVVEPDAFITLLRDRLNKQYALLSGGK